MRLPCAGGLIRLAGPRRVAEPLAELLGSLSMPAEALPVLDVIVSPDAGTADGVVDGRVMWSVALPAGAPAGTLLAQIVGTLTTLLTRLLYVHAGAVAVEGRGIILVGESGAGKTSTVAALVRRGAAYLSDEVALLDPASRTVTPFSVPMAIKSWTRKAAGTLPLGRSIVREGGVEFWLPSGLAPEPIGIETFVLLCHGKSEKQLQTLSPASMLLAIARQASSFRQQHRIQQAFVGFSHLLRNARCMVLETPRPAAHADMLMSLARRPA